MPARVVRHSHDIIGYAYAFTVAIGGTIGYMKAGSVPSLCAGIVFGTALCYGAYQLSENPNDYMLSLITSLVLGGFMGVRFYNSGKLIPSGLIASISFFNAARLGARAAGIL